VLDPAPMKATIVVLPGDGIGPEVTAEGVRVLAAVAAKFGHTFELREALIGGCAIDKLGTALPAETSAMCQASDAILLGAVGGPQWDDPNAAVRPEQGLFAIRRELGLFANLRPVTTHPRLMAASTLKPEVLAGVDLLVVRELTGGLYFGEKKRTADKASDLCEYTADEVRRVVRRAASFARARRKKLTSVDKANALETSRLWRRVTQEVVQKEFPEVALEHILVDACAMYLMRKPSSFDVIVTENMFGDILTDEASVLAGSMGLLPSASLGEGKRGLYEPIHGSAPDIAGKGIANPYATILSVAMLLRHSLDLESEAKAVEKAVDQAIENGVLPGDIAGTGRKGASTVEAGQAVVAAI
jgi:3-isopropylmalate dehydrogenase